MCGKGADSELDGFTIFDLSAWTRVRHSPATGNWHQSTDNLAGSDVYGDSNNDSGEWSIKFDDLSFSEMLFTLGDKSTWMIMTKAQAVGDFYSNKSRNVLKSSYNSNSYTSKMFNAAATP